MKRFMKKVKFRENEAGQVLIWVLALVILGSIVLGPSLQLMYTALMSSHLHGERMQRFYAADAGIEDAVYKIQHSDDYPDYVPPSPYDSCSYNITDVNGYQINVTIENLWILEGLESDEHGVFPHAELVVMGQLTTQPTTTLNGSILDIQDFIPVVSTAGFPEQGTICIDTELIEYGGIDQDLNWFTGCTRGDNAASHADGATVYGEGTLQIDIIYDGSVGLLFVDRIGAWLPPGFSYVSGSSAGIPEHPDIPDNPEEIAHRGGTALVWDCAPPQGIKFEELPTLAPPEGGFEPGAEFPTKRSLLFRFTPSPGGEPRGIFAWIRTLSMDLYLSWDIATGFYKVTSTAQEADGGPQTTLESYIGKSRLHGRVQQAHGDYRAIGNSLMRDIDGDSSGIRDVLDPQSSASISDILADAIVEAAYLYWSAWWWNEDADTDATFRAEDAAGVVLFDGTVNADRWQLLQNKCEGSKCSYSYSCFADVTPLLETITYCTVTVSATGGTSEEVTITRIPDEAGVAATVKIIAASANPGDLEVDGQTIEPGGNVTLELDNVAPSYTLRLSDVDKEPCMATIYCTEGRVLVDDGTSSFILRAEGTFSGNGDYTVGGIQGDIGDMWSYAGWSLVIIYSSPSEYAHQLYLYDDFLYADEDTTHSFTVISFEVPELEPGEQEWGRLTVFVGEGDECYPSAHYPNPDYIEFKGSRLPHSGDPYDGINPQDNVWNGKSSGLGGMFIDGVDIDTFDVSDDLAEGDTSALVELGTGVDSWNLVYIILSFRTIPHEEETGLPPVGIISYTYQ